jgi:hypothetical protein
MGTTRRATPGPSESPRGDDEPGGLPSASAPRAVSCESATAAPPSLPRKFGSVSARIEAVGARIEAQPLSMQILLLFSLGRRHAMGNNSAL